jgi:hypothetical protein
MPRKAKLAITDSGHAKPPDFSIPAPAAKHHDAAAQHYGEAARHLRQAAKLNDSAPYEKANPHAHLADAHHQRGLQHDEEAAKTHLKNHLDDSH